MGTVAVWHSSQRCHARGFRECIGRVEANLRLQFSVSRRDCLCEGASSVLESKMVQIERQDTHACVLVLFREVR